ncbi:oxidoreductase-like domain-containing protein [Cupriavidus nantongensis]|uniref:oxidoreductase-like domain-containing protein n=1 Tax=Cupriavidus nantongensis TaxID=1796606 RepID=UPI0009ED6C33|nr:oxidoreductase-like domain-containing protein [Cupriavidus nantongensis]
MSPEVPVVPVAGSSLTPDDPRPEPPERPADGECCGSGCDPCIFDYYYQEMDRYREALRAWEARQAARHAEDPAA